MASGQGCQWVRLRGEMCVFEHFWRFRLAGHGAVLHWVVFGTVRDFMSDFKSAVLLEVKTSC